MPKRAKRQTAKEKKAATKRDGTKPEQSKYQKRVVKRGWRKR